MPVANLPAATSRKFNPADYRTSPQWFNGRFLSQLNLFTDPVYTSLLNGLTFAQNFNAQTYKLSITGAASYIGNTASFKCTISGAPVGMILIAKNVATDLTIPVISPIDFSWYYNAGVIYLTGISGLTPGTSYAMTFLIF
jgi:hypothetical protein